MWVHIVYILNSVTAHSGLAHLVQLTTIYMRGLLGARHLFT
jgi:hypothetical protein